MAGFRLFAVAVALLATVAEANVATRLAAPTARVARNFVSPFARKFLPDIPRRQPPQTTPFYFTAVAVVTAVHTSFFAHRTATHAFHEPRTTFYRS